MSEISAVLCYEIIEFRYCQNTIKITKKLRRRRFRETLSEKLPQGSKFPSPPNDHRKAAFMGHLIRLTALQKLAMQRP